MHQKRRNPGIIFWLLSVLYSLAVAFRNLLFDLDILKQIPFPVPVISVGNITVGGTGKTPHVEYLIRILHKERLLGVLSRGYKRKTGDIRFAALTSPTHEIGDEPKQIKLKFPDVHLAVSRKRVDGVKALMERYPGIRAIILDDAFQHRYIKPGLSILLVDYTRPLKSDRMLPYGNLRENRHELSRAHIVIVTKTPENIKPIEKMIFENDLDLFPYQFLFFTTYQYKDPVPVYSINKQKKSIGDIQTKDTAILLVTGIASSKSLAGYLHRYCSSVTEVKYPDHHRYSHEDLERISSKFEGLTSKHKLIITTEKDAVKMNEISEVPGTIVSFLYYIPVEVKFLFNGSKRFNKSVVDYVGKNKAVNKLHK